MPARAKSPSGAGCCDGKQPQQCLLSKNLTSLSNKLLNIVHTNQDTLQLINTISLG